jgi:chromosome segregation ATPase
VGNVQAELLTSSAMGGDQVQNKQASDVNDNKLQASQQSMERVTAADKGLQQQLDSSQQDSVPESQLLSQLQELQKQLEMVQSEKESLEALVKKKDKIIQGLNLKQRKIAKGKQAQSDKAKTEEADKKPENEASKDTTGTPAVEEQMNRSTADNLSMSVMAETSYSLEHALDDVGHGDPLERVRELLSEKQYVCIERDMLKELCNDKDAEIVQLQTKVYDTEFHWKEVVAARDAEITALMRRRHGDQDQFQGKEESLLREKKCLEHDLEDKLSELTDVSQQLSRTRRDLAAEEEKVQQLNDYVEQLQNQHFTVSKQLESYVAYCTQLQESITYLQNQASTPSKNQTDQVSAESQEVASLRAENEKQRSEVKKLKFTLASVKEKISSLEKEKEEVNGKMETLAVRCQELENSLHDKTQETDELLKRVSEKEEQNAVMERVMKGMLAEKDSEESSLTTLLSQLETTTSENSALKNQLAEINKTLKKKEARVAAVSKQMKDKARAHLLGGASSDSGSSLGSQHLNVSSDAMSSSIHTDLSTSQVAAGDVMTATVHEEVTAVKASTGDLDSLQLKLAEMDKKTAALQTELDNTCKQLKKRDARLLALTKKLKTAQSTPAASDTSGTDILDSASTPATPSRNPQPRKPERVDDYEIEELLRERDHLDMCLHDAEDSLQRAEERNDVLEQDLEDCELRLQRCEADRDQLEDDLLDLQALIHQIPRHEHEYLLNMRDTKACLHTLLAQRASYAATMDQRLQELAWERDSLRTHLAKAEDFIRHLQAEKQDKDKQQLMQAQNVPDIRSASQYQTASAAPAQSVPEIMVSDSDQAADTTTLREQLSQAEYTMQQLQGEVASLQYRIQQLEYETANLQHNNEQLELEKTNLQQNLTALEGELDISIERYRTVEDQLQEMQNRTSIGEEIAQADKGLEDRLQELQEQRSADTNTLQELNMQLEQARKEKHVLETLLDEVRQDLAEADNYYQRLNQDLTNQCQQLEQHIAEIRQENSTLVAQKSFAHEEMVKGTDKLVTLEAVLKKACHDKEMAEKQAAASERDVDSQKTRADKLLKLLREKEAAEAAQAEQCASLSHTAAELQSQLADLQSERDTLHSTLSALQGQESGTRQEAAHMADDMKNKDERIALLHEQVVMMEQTLVSRNDDYIQLGQMLSNLKAELWAKTQQADKAQEDLKTLSADSIAVKEELEKVHTDLASLQSKSSTLEQQLEQAQYELTRSQFENSSLQEQLQTLGGDEQSVAHHMEIAKLTSDNEQLKHKVGQLEAQQEADQEKITLLQKQLFSMTEHSSKNEETKLQLEQQVGDLQTSESQYKNQLAEASQNLVQYQEYCQQQTDSITQLQQQLTESSEQVRQYYEYSQQLTYQITTLQQQLAESQGTSSKETPESQGEIETLRSDLLSANNAKAELQTEVMSLQQQLVAAKQEVSVSEERLRKAESYTPQTAHSPGPPSASSSSESVGSDVESLKSKVQELQKSGKKKDAKVLALTKQLDKAKAEIASLTQQLSQSKPPVSEQQTEQAAVPLQAETVSQQTATMHLQESAQQPEQHIEEFTQLPEQQLQSVSSPQTGAYQYPASVPQSAFPTEPTEQTFQEAASYFQQQTPPPLQDTFNTSSSIAGYFTPVQSPALGSTFSTPAVDPFSTPMQSSNYSLPTPTSSHTPYYPVSANGAAQVSPVSTPTPSTWHSPMYSTPTSAAGPALPFSSPHPSVPSPFAPMSQAATSTPRLTGGAPPVPRPMPLNMTMINEMSQAELRQQLIERESHVSESWDNCILL